MPCRRQRSFVSAPASDSLSTPMICSSVNRFPFIELSFPKSMENSKPRSASFRGQGHSAYHHEHGHLLEAQFSLAAQTARELVLRTACAVVKAVPSFLLLRRPLQEDSFGAQHSWRSRSKFMFAPQAIATSVRP